MYGILYWGIYISEVDNHGRKAKKFVFTIKT